MSNAANYDEGDSRTELVARLGALVADADAYTYTELVGAPASDAISGVLLT